MAIKIELSYEDGFSNIYDRYLNTEKGRKLLSIEGISPDKFDRRLQSRYYHVNNVADVSVDSNANASGTKSPLNYRGEIGKAFDKIDGLYLLWKFGSELYGEDTATDLIEAIISGDLYFHDSTQVDVPYCFAASFSRLMTEGRPWAMPVGLPPKKLKSFISQVSETVMDLSQEFVGAIAVSDLIVSMIYYVRKDAVSDYEIRDAFQSFVHIINNKFRISGQSPFTNVSLFDKSCYEQLFSDMIFPDGSSPTWEEFDRIQRIYGEWYSKGDPSTGLPYSFPVTTLNCFIENGKPSDQKTFKWFTEINLEKGGFNFFLTTETGKLASCCRLINDLNLLSGVNSAFGNGGLNLGSARVVTVNLPRIAYKVRTKYPDYDDGDFSKAFNEELDIQLERTKKLLLTQRHILKHRIDHGYLKFFDYEWCNLDLHLFSTVGYVGIYEALEVLKKDPLSEESIKISIDILSHMKDRTFEWSEETGIAFNLEQIPAESAAYKLADKDKLFYTDVADLYSNQFVPLTRKSNVIERLNIDGKFTKYITGGGIVHINLGEKLNYKKQMEAICKAAIKVGCLHFAVNYSFCICSEDETHVTHGGPKTKYCPICGSPIKDHLTRVIGYFVKVSGWAKPRKIDFTERDYNQVVSI